MTQLENFVRRYVSVTAVIDTLQRCELALLDPQTWDDRNDRHFMALYKSKRKLTALYALCAAHCSETYHHWSVFAPGKDGACLEIKRKPLEDALAGNDNVRSGDVAYLTLNEVEALHQTDLDRLPFSKRQGFAAEKEYRIVAWSDESKATAMGIPIDLRWINKIYLNPWMPKPLARSLQDTLRSLPKCSKLKVVRSLLIDSQRWKDAGDKVVGASPTKAIVQLALKSPKTASKR